MFISYCVFKKTKHTHTINYKKIVFIAGRICTCAILMMTSLTAECQWKVWHYESGEKNTVSLLPSKNQLKQGYTFFAITDDYDKNVITGGYEPFLKNKLWKIKLNEPKGYLARRLYFNLYSENISALKLQVCESNGKCYERRFEFAKDGYQIPFEWAIDKAAEVTAGTHKQSGDNSPLCYVTIELKDIAKTYKLIVGEAKSYEENLIKSPSKGLFFGELTGKKENQIEKTVIRNFGDSYPLNQKTELSTNTSAIFNFEYEGADSEGRQKATLNLIRYFFQKYPFYKEHALDKQAILSSIDTLISGSLVFTDKVELLKGIADHLYDGHFYFQRPDKSRIRSKISSPLILKRINNQVQVVGIKDGRLESKISLGDQLRLIEDKSCEKWVDSLSTNYFGNSAQRQELAISHLFENQIDSSLQHITLEKSDGSRYQVSLNYDKVFPIPRKFVPEHFGFRRVKNNWIYLKINKWDRGDWIKFYNLKDSLKNAGGIIFDLRGNPGGYEIETIKIASCFIGSPMEYSTQTYSTSDKLYTGKTIVKPNSFLDLSGLKIIILVDNKTACASESFALILKEKKGATIVGTATTSSSFSTVHAYQLPEGIILNANILSKIYLLNNQKTIEYQGITPDLTVKINDYSDLYGYHDKVLHTAFEMIEHENLQTTLQGL